MTAYTERSPRAAAGGTEGEGAKSMLDEKAIPDGPVAQLADRLADRGRGTHAAMRTTFAVNGAPAPVSWRVEDRAVSVRSAASRSGRSLAGYLVMPRPGDAVKALLMPLTFGLGVLADGGTDARTLVRALLVLVVLEFLVYPARYQWNDIRGFAADQRHPGESDRGRLPGPLSLARSRILASGVVAVLRLALAGIVAVLPGLGLGGLVLTVFLGVFGVAAGYEALRAAATGRHSGDATPPVTPALAALWIAVGAGYAVRGMIGFSLALNLPSNPALSVAAAVTLWAYGVAFVTSRWAVESLAFARLGQESVTWSADASHAREHLLALTRWLPSQVESRALAGPGGESLDHWAVLRGPTPAWAPWNVAVTITGAAAAVTGLLLSGGAAGRAGWIVAMIGGATSLAATRLHRSRVVLTVAGGAGLLAAFLAVSLPHPLVAVLPWLAVMVAYVHFSAQSMTTMGHLGRIVRGAVGRLLAPPVRLIVGRPTWHELTSSRPARG
jgi:hypothetical protein